jgi:hypothetical protein
MSFVVRNDAKFDSVDSTSLAGITISGNPVSGVQLVSGTAATTLSTAGGLVRVPANTSGGSLAIALPAQAAGQRYRFVMTGTAGDAYTIALLGARSLIVSTTGAGAATLTADSGTTLTIAATAVAGDYFDLDMLGAAVCQVSGMSQTAVDFSLA